MRFLALFIALAIPAVAHATVNYYTNPVYGFSFSYPDDWMAQSEPDGPPYEFKIVPDEGRARAYCQITSQEDRRFMIYPAKHQADLMQREFGPEFWMGWLAEDSDLVFIDVFERAGLGDGQATSVLVDYTTPQGVPERSLLAATIHGGVRYVFQCASTQEDFAKYEPLFHQVIATLKLRPAYAPFPQGFYRDFTGDKDIYFPLGEGIGTSAF